MTPQHNKPSCHDVIVGTWKPTPFDIAANRYPGFGVITNIINGGIECGLGPNAEAADRVGFYKSYCDLLEVFPGDYMDCDNQRSFKDVPGNPKRPLLKMPVDQA